MAPLKMMLDSCLQEGYHMFTAKATYDKNLFQEIITIKGSKILVLAVMILYAEPHSLLPWQIYNTDLY